jgi:FtsH-binding integral membrane protein
MDPYTQNQNLPQNPNQNQYNNNNPYMQNNNNPNYNTGFDNQNQNQYPNQNMAGASNPYYNQQNPTFNNQPNPSYNPNNSQPNIYNKDIENHNEELIGEGDQITFMMRLGFIRKVYGILSFQLLFTVAFICMTFSDTFAKFLLTNLAIFYVCIALSLVVGIALICFKKVARTSPTNYILLAIWTFCESWMVATCSATYDPKSVMVAGVLTAGVTISLTYYACTTKTDFTFCGGMLFAGSCIMFLMGIFFLIFGITTSNFPLLNIVYCGFGVMLYSMYLIYDTQLVMGKFGAEYSIDDYILAAMMIYIDIIQLFLYILQLLGSRR